MKLILDITFTAVATSAVMVLATYVLRGLLSNETISDVLRKEKR